MGKDLPKWNKEAQDKGYGGLKEMVNHLYWDKSMSSRAVAKELGVTVQRALQIMKKLDVPRRPMGGPNR